MGQTGPAARGRRVASEAALTVAAVEVVVAPGTDRCGVPVCTAVAVPSDDVWAVPPRTS